MTIKLKSVEIIIHSFKTAVICNIPLSFTSEIFKRITQIFFIYPFLWLYFKKKKKRKCELHVIICLIYQINPFSSPEQQGTLWPRNNGLWERECRLTSPGIITDVQENEDEIQLNVFFCILKKIETQESFIFLLFIKKLNTVIFITGDEALSWSTYDKTFNIW